MKLDATLALERRNLPVVDPVDLFVEHWSQPKADTGRVFWFSVRMREVPAEEKKGFRPSGGDFFNALA